MKETIVDPPCPTQLWSKTQGKDQPSNPLDQQGHTDDALDQADDSFQAQDI